MKLCDVCVDIPPFDLPKIGPVGLDVGAFTNGKWGVKGYVDIPVAGQQGFYVDTTPKFAITGVSNYRLVSSRQVQAYRRMQELKRATLEPAQSGGIAFPSANEVLLITTIPQPGTSAKRMIASDVYTDVTVSSQSDTLFSIASTEALTMSLITPDGQEITSDNYQSNADYTIQYQNIITYSVERSTEADDAFKARLRFVAASPHPSVALVDVVLDGTTIFAGVDASNPAPSDYINVDAGTHTLQIVASEGGASILSSEIELSRDTDYTLFTVGESTPETLLLVDENNAPNSFGQAKVRLVNAGPTTIDLFMNDVEKIDSMAYKGAEYLSIPAGDYTIDIKEASSGDVFVSSGSDTLSFSDGGVYTIIATDWMNGPLHIGSYQQLMDESYRTSSSTHYQVEKAAPGDWQIKLSGNVTDATYVVSVVGLDRAPTIEANLDIANLADSKLNWQITSGYSSTLGVYLTPGPITETFTITDNLGIPSTDVRPLYTGFVVSEQLITDPQLLAGEVTTSSIDLSTLASSDYYMWVRIDDGTNPPMSAYVTKPDSEELVKIHIDHRTDYPDTWSTTITPTLTITDHAFDIEWTAMSHPDMDRYVIYLGTAPISATRAISIGTHFYDYDENGNLIGGPRGYFRLTNVVPGTTYYLSIGAIDDQSGKIALSPEFELPQVSSGDFELKASEQFYPIAAGQTITIPITIDAQDLYYPDVSMFIDTGDKRGLNAYYEESDETGMTILAPTTQTQVNLIVEASSTIPDGSYTISSIGNNWNTEKTLDLRLQVGPLAVNLALFEAEANGDSVLIRWQTVSELDNLGFNLYRATERDGEQIRLNSDLILAQAPGSGQGADYSFLDTNVEVGSTYFYWLEDVDVNGESTRHGPVSAAATAPTAITTGSLTNSSHFLLRWAILPLGLLLLASAYWRRRQS